MSVVCNVLWIFLGGFFMGLCYILGGLLFCITIFGIPIGVQLMKIGVYCFAPFGYEPTMKDGKMGCLNMGFNILWIVFGGIELALAHLVVGVIFCFTFIGIPFGVQHFKIARLALFPFGQSFD